MPENDIVDIFWILRNDYAQLWQSYFFIQNTRKFEAKPKYITQKRKGKYGKYKEQERVKEKN